MKIDIKKTAFGGLFGGDVFYNELTDQYFIKIMDSSANNSFNAVSPVYGNCIYVDDDEIVTPVKAKLVIKH